MIDYKSRELLENTLNRARWVAVALVGSLFADAVVVELLWWFMAPFTGFMPENEIPSLFQYVLVGIGLSDLVFLPFLRRSMLAAWHGSQPATLISRLMSMSIVSLAISCVPAILGLVIFLIWAGRLAFYALWGASLFFMLVYFPRQSFWEEWVEGGGRMEL